MCSWSTITPRYSTECTAILPAIFQPDQFLVTFKSRVKPSATSSLSHDNRRRYLCFSASCKLQTSNIQLPTTDDSCLVGGIIVPSTDTRSNHFPRHGVGRCRYTTSASVILNSEMPLIRLSRRDPSSTPLPYTASPLLLFCRDILLFLRYVWALPGILLPLRLGHTTPLDELYLSFGSLISFSVQVILSIAQIAFLVSIPLMVIFMIPAFWITVYAAVGFSLNYAICTLALNGFERILVSNVPLPSRESHEKECWFFINGVANR